MPQAVSTQYYTHEQIRQVFIQATKLHVVASGQCLIGDLRVFMRGLGSRSISGRELFSALVLPPEDLRPVFAIVKKSPWLNFHWWGFIPNCHEKVYEKFPKTVLQYDDFGPLPLEAARYVILAKIIQKDLAVSQRDGEGVIRLCFKVYANSQIVRMAK